MNRTILDIHILQTVPPSNLNRDDTGTPKSATYGGVRRSRVSSQAWKRATREAFGELLDSSELGIRTKKVVEVLAERVMELDSSLPPAAAQALAAETITTATGSKVAVPGRKSKQDAEDAAPAESTYLMFLSNRQYGALAAMTVEGGKGGDLQALKDFFKVKENKARAKQLVLTEHSVDIALFGRMVADSTDLNVDAAAQVAHALSVHAVEVESDYYTAVDDKNTDAETGAGMIGTIDFNSATLYRYAALDVNRLQENLGAGHDDARPVEPTRRAVAAFLEGFITSLPTGKINTFGNQTLPAAVIVKVRSRRPVSYVAAFEEPVALSKGGGFLKGSCKRLARFVPNLEASFGLSGGPEGWVLRVGEETEDLSELGRTVNLPELLVEVGDAVAARLAPEPSENGGPEGGSSGAAPESGA
ncbi:type I-E CRISPR-associated protein Cas7/Cse4/CasC [Streptomyces sp. SID8359]|uniref:type I-E CRISPR-associated protein Cas7/Cse4/CasC n=1 Tax=unclassified Streptomyces TaxID=2593676 RepID=UPI000516F4CE|nr:MULTISPECIES: type I-E CRISPR-associated protein Cas7/Cse4/CasC [unclassified Streptomyces]MYT90026.1 type I-E CRISPR-associated protein Cas7/Cse4/CasC [Streptomyces sp. SID8359]NGO85094.1 type I-E CRISPR-associated protein Cas7/Cse4/CasC [Streptomyces sp. 196(2019)]